MRLGRRLAAVVAGVAMAILPAAPCFACSCAGWTYAETFEHAEAVFTGIVLTDPKPAEGANPPDPGEVSISVEEVHKGGPLPPTVTVASSLQGPACGLPFRQGARWTVFATVDGDRFETNSCAGTRPGHLDPDAVVPMHPGFSERAAPDPRFTAAPPPPREGEGVAPAIALVGMASAGLAAVVLTRRRRPIPSPPPTP